MEELVGSRVCAEGQLSQVLQPRRCALVLHCYRFVCCFVFCCVADCLVLQFVDGQELGVIPLWDIRAEDVRKGEDNLHQFDGTFFWFIFCALHSLMLPLFKTITVPGPGGRTYRMCARSDRERDEWIDAVRNSILYHNTLDEAVRSKMKAEIQSV